MNTTEASVNSSNSSGGDNKAEDTAALYQVGDSIIVIGGSIILVLGVICNTLALVVLQKRKLFNTGVSTYLSALSICDSIFLIFSLLTWILYSSTGIFLGSLIECNLIFFLNYVPSNMSSFLQVAISFDRFVLLYFPVRSKNSPDAGYIVLLLLLLSVLTNWHYLGGLKKGNTHDITSACIGRNELTQSYHDMYSVWLDSVFYSFVPALLIMISNSLIIHKNMKQYRVVATGMTSAAAQTYALDVRRRRRDRVTQVALLVTFAFVFFTTPFCLLYLVDMDEDSAGPWKNAMFYVIGTVLLLVMHLNHCINLFIYCLVGKGFRSHLLKYLCCKKTQVHPEIAIIPLAPLQGT